MNRLLSYVLLLVIFSPAAIAQEAQDLVGLWQHDDQPVVVAIIKGENSMDGLVQSNEARPESVGRQLFSDLVFDDKDRVWRGQIYVLRLEENRDVTIELLSADQFRMTIKLGFMSRSVTWSRVEGS